MTTSDLPQLATVPVVLDNPGDWNDIATQLAAASNTAGAVTPDLLATTVGSAVPILFAADRTGDPDMLRGTFGDQVIAQRHQNVGSFNGDTPVSVTLHLIGAPTREGSPVIRVHLLIATQATDGSNTVNSQFWDFAVDSQVVVGRTTCPNCGAPLPEGQLVCGHCHTDVRQVVSAPLVVSRLELY
jgi:hypothetical protein